MSILLAMVTLLASLRVVAQGNTGATPYQDSRHTYRVTIGTTTNAQEWTIVNAANTVTYNLTDATPEAWCTYTAATTNGGYDVVTIFFDRNFFAEGDWLLRFTETDKNNTCVSAREYPITVVANTFYLTLAGDAFGCNSQTGLVHTYDEVDAPADVFATSVNYTVTMNKSDDFDPTLWRFTVTFPQAVGSITTTVNTADGGTAAITELAPNNQTTYRVTLTPGATNPSMVEVVVSVSYSNNVLADVARNVTVTEGEAVYSAPPAPDAITDDNITTFPLSAPGDRVQAITIYAIPATRDIAPGAGETVISAQNPLQNSTHRYAVQMGDVANFSRVNTRWHIETTTGTVVPDIAANYELVRPDAADVTSSGSDSATISFHMAPGTYMLYYTEENSNGCTTVRRFPISLGDPFDADILTVADQCSGANGVIFQNLQDSTTTIEYTVALDMTYTMNWEFGIEVTSTPGFSNPDLEVSSISILGTYAVYTSATTTSGTVAVTNSTGTVNSVTVRVVYHGLYESAHTITLTLPDGTIHGSFGETDRDDGTTLDGGGTEGVINQARHIIHAMPQAGTLAGID